MRFKKYLIIIINLILKSDISLIESLLDKSEYLQIICSVRLLSHKFVILFQSRLRYMMKQLMFKFSKKKRNSKTVSVDVKRLVSLSFWLNYIKSATGMTMKSYAQVSRKKLQKN